MALAMSGCWTFSCILVILVSAYKTSWLGLLSGSRTNSFHRGSGDVDFCHPRSLVYMKMSWYLFHFIYLFTQMQIL